MSGPHRFLVLAPVLLLLVQPGSGPSLRAAFLGTSASVLMTLCWSPLPPPKWSWTELIPPPRFTLYPGFPPISLALGLGLLCTSVFSSPSTARNGTFPPPLPGDISPNYPPPPTPIFPILLIAPGIAQVKNPGIFLVFFSLSLLSSPSHPFAIPLGSVFKVCPQSIPLSFSLLPPQFRPA